MQIKPINTIDEKTTLFLAKNGSVFIQPEWLKIYDSSKLELCGIYNKDNVIIGAFTLYIDSKFGLKWIKLPPYSPHTSLCYINPSSNNAKKITFDKKIYKLIDSYLTNKKVSLITLSFPPSHIDMQPFIWSNYKAIPNYTYQLDLDKCNEENILSVAAPEKRNELKKAIKDNIDCKLSYDYSITKKMVEHSFNRKNKSLNSDLLSKILHEFATKDNSFSFISYLNNKPIAASFIIYDNNTAYYLLGGYDPQNKHNGAGVFAVSNAIKESKKRGLKIFDFEGSMLVEVEKYFRGFGGDLTPFFTINKGSFLLEVLLKRSKRAQF